MRKIKIAKDNILASAVGLGCMRIANMDLKEVENLIRTSMEVGINFFDHADIYGEGESQRVFSKALNMNSKLREEMIIQSKCGIRKGFFDFSKEHIINSVEGTLKDLNTDYIDILLLHRPDTLMEMEEINEAFNKLHLEGKVKFFGVSNHNPMQIELLNKYLDKKILINQIQFSIMHSGIIDNGLNVNMKVNSAINRDGSLLEYCRINNISLQAWSPFQHGFFGGTFIDNPDFPDLNNKLQEIASKYNVSKTAIATAWILRHPANIQPIAGTTNVNRIKEISEGAAVELTREEWYGIYTSAGNILP